MLKAIDLALKNVGKGTGGPFGAVITKDGVVISAEANKVTGNNDPTAHAEVEAIRAACKQLNTFDLSGCEIYSSCEPCPMCLSAIYWSRIDKIYYAGTRYNAADIGFDDAFLYRELTLPATERSLPSEQLFLPEVEAAFKAWSEKPDRTRY